MIIERIVQVPAVPAVPATTRVVKDLVCDKCRALAEEKYTANTCDICGRRFHHACDPGGCHHGDGDYPDYICGDCWRFGEPYRQRAEEHERQAEVEVEAWHRAAKKAAEEPKP